MTNTTPTHTVTTTITTITDISLAKLIPSPANVRRTGAGTGIEALAASIQAHGLLQSLVVRPQLDADGQETGRYEVVAGGRRLAALRLLAKRKRIAKGTAIPCRVLDGAAVDGTSVNGMEASLAENVVRQDMHPADQFEAFAALHEAGIGVEDIAARFGVSAHTVRQRLRLAVVAPALIQAYRDEADARPPDRVRGDRGPGGTGAGVRAVARLAAPSRHDPAAADPRVGSGDRPQGPARQARGPHSGITRTSCFRARPFVLSYLLASPHAFSRLYASKLKRNNSFSLSPCRAA